MKSFTWAGAGMLIWTLVGCAHQGEIKPAQAGPPAATAGGSGGTGHYVVKRHDSLWAISAKSGVLGDAFRWPLLYKQNRDQIQDPDLIEVGQDLGYGKAFAASDIDAAVALAKETPPYVPHAAPRKSLPLKY